MGAGKTTFIHALCEVKGVKDVVGSPTFSIINEYSYPGGMIFHIDLYRLKNEEEAIRAGVEDCLYSDHICFVEWPERAPGIFPPDAIHAYIELIDSDTRHLTIPDKQLFLIPGLNTTIKQRLRVYPEFFEGTLQRLVILMSIINTELQPNRETQGDSV